MCIGTRVHMCAFMFVWVPRMGGYNPDYYHWVRRKKLRNEENLLTLYLYMFASFNWLIEF